MANREASTSALDAGPTGASLRRSALFSAGAGLVAALAAALALGSVLGLGVYYVAKVLAAYGLVLLILFLFLQDHRLYARLGPANQVTLGRALIGALLFGLVGEGGAAAVAWSAFALALVAEALDWVDGRLARRGGWASPFGARFDMETDALLVLTLSLLAWSMDKAGVWVLAAGLLRYAFVAAGYLFPWLLVPLPPSHRRQAICVVQILTLTAALAPAVPIPWSGLIAGVGLALLCWSFAVDLAWLAGAARADSGSHSPQPLPRGGRVLDPGVGGGIGLGDGRRVGFDWTRWLGLAAALYLLNLVLSFHNLWPTPWVADRHELSVEIALLVLALALWAEWYRPPRRGVRIALAALLTLSALARYAEVTAPALYGRPVNLFWDARHLPKVAAMLLEVAPLSMVAAGALGLSLLLVLLYGLITWALRQVWWGLDSPLPRRAMGGVAAVVAALYLGGMVNKGLGTERCFSRPISATYAAQAGFLLDAMASDGAARDLPQSPAVASDLARVRGAQVVVLFLESYGAVTYDRPRIAEAVVPARADLERAIAETGREAVSAYVRSTTFGGNSWLAHASLLSGIPVDDNGTYSLLLTQDRDTLVHRFARGGWHPVAVMPGLRQDWPEGAFYGFETTYGARALDYRGPPFGWWRIPDQYALARLDALELSAAHGPPRFAFFTSISSHAPFRPTPPYQPDWVRMLSPEPYDPARLAAALAGKPDWTDLAPSYADSVAYALTWIAGYLRHRPDLDLVLLVLGDHQPPASVSGEGADWLVPVHLIASRGDVLGALIAQGFRPGLTPARPDLGPIQGLYGMLLHAFSSPSPERKQAESANERESTQMN